MATIKWSALGTTTTYLSTDLNALANGANKIGAEIDNTADKHTYALLELYLAAQGVARDSGGYVALYVIKSVDGTNYEFGGDALDPPSSAWVTNFTLDADTAARYVGADIPVPPCKFKFLVINETGQALAATLNTLKYRFYDLEVA